MAEDNASTHGDHHWQDGLERLSEEQHQSWVVEIITRGMKDMLLPSSPPWRGQTWSAVSSSGLPGPRETWACCSESGHRSEQGMGASVIQRAWESWDSPAWNRGCTKGGLSNVSMFQVGGNEEK